MKKLLCISALVAVNHRCVLAEGLKDSFVPLGWDRESSSQPIGILDFFGGLKYPRNLWNQTVRQVARVSIGGSRSRRALQRVRG